MLSALRFLAPFCLVCIVLSANAQKRSEYLDAQFNVVPVESSRLIKYVRDVTQLSDSTFEVKVNFKTGEAMMTGRYLDTDLLVEDGDFTYFYANGTAESMGRYRNGSKVGTWKRWNYDGREKPDRFYPDENFRRSSRTTASAKFPGGTDALRMLVRDSLNYPLEAKDRGIEGTVVVTFVIDAAGDVRQAEVTDGVHYLLDEEALRFVSNMPAWAPATRHGVPVDTSFIMPITFSLKNDQGSMPSATTNSPTGQNRSVPNK
ncbi:MAG: TonB family protein [Flavobacteriales bacterium]|jgi:TonB family protein